MARHAAELQQQLGGPGVWRQARPQWERAEASHAQDRQQALQADQNEVSRLRDRAASHDTAALDAGTRRDELLGEQQLRASMPDTQRSLEHELRSEAIQRQRVREHATLDRQPDPHVHAELDYQRTLHADVHHDVHRDVDRGGPSLGL